jgi:uncharacterized protein HemX
MANWRVLIIVAVAIALGFWAGVIAQQQQDNALADADQPALQRSAGRRRQEGRTLTTT